MTGEQFLDNLLVAGAIFLSAMVLMCLIRAIKGPRFTDRLVAVNMIGTMTITIMCLLSVYFEQSFLVDISIIYALLSFITVVVLSRLVIIRNRIHRLQQEKQQQGKNGKPLPGKK